MTASANPGNNVDSTVTLRVGEETAEIQALADTSTGVTDINREALDQAVKALQPQMDASHQEDAAIEARFAAFAEAPDTGQEISMDTLTGLFDSNEG